MGMVGGGGGAFIGAIHRLAAGLTGTIDLSAGAFSRDAAASQRFGVGLGLDDDRAYGSWQQMLEAETRLPVERRIECVSIVTPNSTHADIACAALEHGFHVICDKPLAGTLEDALRVEAAAQASGLRFALTHTYTGYPLVIEARERVRSGEIGTLRRISVSYLQDWLSRPQDTNSSRQAAWRTDPAVGGESGAFADIGTHAFNLVEFITGQAVTDIAAELRRVVPGRSLDDDGAALFRMTGGASGTITVSQVSTGAVNDLRIEVYGDQGGLHWAQQEPNRLTIRRRGEPDQVLYAGVNAVFLSDAARARCRTPAGHPEGYIEAFANLYADFARTVRAWPDDVDTVGASVADGVRAMRFVRAAITSSKNGSRWTPLEA